MDTERVGDINECSAKSLPRKLGGAEANLEEQKPAIGGRISVFNQIDDLKE